MEYESDCSSGQKLGDWAQKQASGQYSGGYEVLPGDDVREGGRYGKENTGKLSERTATEETD